MSKHQEINNNPKPEEVDKPLNIPLGKNPRLPDVGHGQIAQLDVNLAERVKQSPPLEVVRNQREILLTSVLKEEEQKLANYQSQLVESEKELKSSWLPEKWSLRTKALKSARDSAESLLNEQSEAVESIKKVASSSLELEKKAVVLTALMEKRNQAGEDFSDLPGEIAKLYTDASAVLSQRKKLDFSKAREHLQSSASLLNSEIETWTNAEKQIIVGGSVAIATGVGMALAPVVFTALTGIVAGGGTLSAITYFIGLSATSTVVSCGFGAITSATISGISNYSQVSAGTKDANLAYADWLSDVEASSMEAAFSGLGGGVSLVLVPAKLGLTALANVARGGLRAGLHSAVSFIPRTSKQVYDAALVFELNAKEQGISGEEYFGAREKFFSDNGITASQLLSRFVWDSVTAMPFGATGARFDLGRQSLREAGANLSRKILLEVGDFSVNTSGGVVKGYFELAPEQRSFENIVSSGATESLSNITSSLVGRLSSPQHQLEPLGMKVGFKAQQSAYSPEFKLQIDKLQKHIDSRTPDLSKVEWYVGLSPMEKRIAIEEIYYRSLEYTYSRDVIKSLKLELERMSDGGALRVREINNQAALDYCQKAEYEKIYGLLKIGVELDADFFKQGLVVRKMNEDLLGFVKNPESPENIFSLVKSARLLGVDLSVAENGILKGNFENEILSLAKKMEGEDVYHLISAYSLLFGHTPGSRAKIRHVLEEGLPKLRRGSLKDSNDILFSSISIDLLLTHQLASPLSQQSSEYRKSIPGFAIVQHGGPFNWTSVMSGVLGYVRKFAGERFSYVKLENLESLTAELYKFSSSYSGLSDIFVQAEHSGILGDFPDSYFVSSNRRAKNCISDGVKLINQILKEIHRQKQTVADRIKSEVDLAKGARIEGDYSKLKTCLLEMRQMMLMQRRYFVSKKKFVQHDIDNPQSWLESRDWQTKAARSKNAAVTLSDETIVYKTVGKPSLRANADLLKVAIERILSNGYHAINEATRPIPDAENHIEITVSDKGEKGAVLISSPGELPLDRAEIDSNSGAQKLFVLNPLRSNYFHNIGMPFAAEIIAACGGTISVRNVISDAGHPRVEFEILLPKSEGRTKGLWQKILANRPIARRVGDLTTEVGEYYQTILAHGEQANILPFLRQAQNREKVLALYELTRLKEDRKVLGTLEKALKLTKEENVQVFENVLLLNLKEKRPAKVLLMLREKTELSLDFIIEHSGEFQSLYQNLLSAGVGKKAQELLGKYEQRLITLDLFERDVLAVAANRGLERALRLSRMDDALEMGEIFLQLDVEVDAPRIVSQLEDMQVALGEQRGKAEEAYVVKTASDMDNDNESRLLDSVIENQTIVELLLSRYRKTAGDETRRFSREVELGIEDYTLISAIQLHGGPLDIKDNLTRVLRYVEWVSYQENCPKALNLEINHLRAEILKEIRVYEDHCFLCEKLPAEFYRFGVDAEFLQSRKDGFIANLERISGLAEKFGDCIRGLDVSSLKEEMLVDGYKLVLQQIERQRTYLKATRALCESMPKQEIVHLSKLLQEEEYQTKVKEFRSMGIPVVIDVAAGCYEVCAHVDSAAFKVAIERIISNGYHHINRLDGLSPEQRRIVIKVAKDEKSNQAIVIVSTPEEIVSKYTDLDLVTGKQRLFTLDFDRKQFHHGIGMPFTARVIERMGGEIRVANVVDSGRQRVEFEIRLPLVEGKDLSPQKTQIDNEFIKLTGSAVTYSVLNFESKRQRAMVKSHEGNTLPSGERTFGQDAIIPEEVVRAGGIHGDMENYYAIKPELSPLMTEILSALNDARYVQAVLMLTQLKVEDAEQICAVPAVKVAVPLGEASFLGNFDSYLLLVTAFNRLSAENIHALRAADIGAHQRALDVFRDNKIAFEKSRLDILIKSKAQHLKLQELAVILDFYQKNSFATEAELHRPIAEAAIDLYKQGKKEQAQELLNLFKAKFPAREIGNLLYGELNVLLKNA
ncbi:MAG: ATP-binding protein, partial [Proteobacteria bacterium]|nr:ATP-binding protein [Pseudomonadota bacterium]